MESPIKFFKKMLKLFLFFPLTVSAHQISITATTPFPATVASNSSTTATFKITNIASKINVAAINKSNFPSGVTVSSSTCGNMMSPGGSCTMQLTLKTPTAGKAISTALKIWAKPTADGVEYPINVTMGSNLPSISLVEVSNTGLPALRDPIIGVSGENWLILSGSFGNFHDFQNDFNTDIYVYNPNTGQIHTVAISATNLPAEVIQQLSSTNPEFLQDGDWLYMIGGFYTADDINYTTIDTITSVNVPGMINAVLNNDTNLAPFVHVNAVPQFAVTGGQLGKIGDDFYLAFGQFCSGDNYCSGSQIYTNSIYKFTMDTALTSINIVDTATHGDLDGSGWRRRDYTLASFKMNNADTLFAMGGPFTPARPPFVWTNGIHFNANLQSNDHFINQQANQYLSPHVTMYSADKGMTYLATFSGLSNLYWSTSGLIHNATTPYGNVLALITANANGQAQEYVNLQPLCSGQPVASCLYMGVTAIFLPVERYYDSRDILMLDQLPQNTSTLIGYVYAGLLSPVQDIFEDNLSYATNRVYAVYVTPAGSNAVQWQNVTNMYPGN